MDIILSDEQIREAMHCPATWDDCKKCGTECIEIAIAQARYLFNLLNEPCTKHPDKLGMYYKHRKNCPKCMAEIEDEMEREIAGEVERG